MKMPIKAFDYPKSKVSNLKFVTFQQFSLELCQIRKSKLATKKQDLLKITNF